LAVVVLLVLLVVTQHLLLQVHQIQVEAQQ